MNPRRCLSFLTVLLGGLLPAALGASPPVETIAPEFLWSAGGADGEVMFGLPVAACGGRNGRVYVLDHQLCQILVFDRNGRPLPALGRRGDGPGEFSTPLDLIRWPDGNLGVLEFFPGCFVLVDEDGRPAGTAPIKLAEAEPGAFVLAQFAAGGGGMVLVGGSGTGPADGGTLRHDFLMLVDARGRQARSLLARPHVIAAGAAVAREIDYLPHFNSLGAVGPDGTVYYVPDRDAYRIAVSGPGGEKVLTREFATRERSAVDRHRLETLFGAWSAHSHDPPRPGLENLAPAVEALHVDGDGNLWVRHSRSAEDLPDGGFLRLDVFAPGAAEPREVVLMAEGNPVLDGLVFLPEGRLLFVRNLVLSRLVGLTAIAGVAPSFGEDDEAIPVQITCYRLP